MATLWNQDEFIRAYLLAARAHKDQKVKGTIDLPYIVHFSLVTMEVLAAIHVEDGLDSDLALQCALLHDVVEDTEMTPESLALEFGERVSLGVQALSKNKALPPSARMADCLERIRRQPREVWMVKLADRITNLQPPPEDWDEQKVADYRREAIEIHKALGSASLFLAERLFAKISRYGRAIGETGQR
jgi:(p)ppGpp synthase/HD superfamily hydrolase